MKTSYRPYICPNVIKPICVGSWGLQLLIPTHRSAQQSTMRGVGALAGFSMAGVSERMQARKALILRFLSSTAFPSQSFFKFGQVHSRKGRASTSSGVWGDFPLYAAHSLTITGGSTEKGYEVKRPKNRPSQSFQK